MTLKSYLLIMSLTTLVSWLAFGFVIFTIDPQITNWVGFALFYTSLFVALIGTFSILGFFIRFILLKEELVFRSVKEAFRQSFLLSFLLLSCMFLLSRNLFNWFNAILLALGLTVMEFFLVSYNKK
jgi:hypothetical protein